MDDGIEATEALRAVLAADQTFRDSPERLARALTDLLPYDDRAVRLLVAGCALGVPALVSTGDVQEARSRLFDGAGMRREVADWVVATWLDTAGTGLVGATAGAAVGALDVARWPDPPPAAWPAGSAFTEEPDETPGGPTTVRLAVASDGVPFLAVITAAGVFATVLPTANGPAPAWRRVAAPRAPGSRDVALTVRGGLVVAYWSDEGGVFARGLSTAHAPGATPAVSLSAHRLVVAAPRAEQPRYPLTAIAPDDRSADLLWTSDRRTLHRTLIRDWPTPDERVVPPPCTAGERLTGLDATVDARAAWLVALTDRGRVLVTRWDLAVDEIATWTAVPTPVAVAAVAIADCAAGPTVLAAARSGHLLSVDAREAAGGQAEWHSVDHPAGAPRGPDTTLVLGAASTGDRAWVAVSGAAGTWLAPLDRTDEVATLGEPRPLATGAG